MRRYTFTWDLLGDTEVGRPHLGAFTKIEVYRLMQSAFRDVIERTVGTQQGDEIFHDAGKLAGQEFYDHYLIGSVSFPDLITNIQDTMKDLGIGIFQLEKSSLDALEFTFTLSEYLDCFGCAELGNEVCTYSEGFIAGIFEEYAGRPFKVKEVDCRCTENQTCRFHVLLQIPTSDSSENVRNERRTQC